jgi:hypothetical protein
MLQMNCPECKGIVKSPFLAELSSIECSHCKVNVPVKDVFVATKGYTIHRDDLLSRIYRYQTLLKEVEKELKIAGEGENVSEKTRKSIEQFYVTLQELLVGARKNFRMDIPFDLPVEMNYRDRQSHGQLKNLSCEGASIAFKKLEEWPKNRDEIELKINIAEAGDPLSILARVVWVKKPAKYDGSEPVAIGVNFINLDENIRSLIWDFIVKTTSPRGF